MEGKRLCEEEKNKIKKRKKRMNIILYTAFTIVGILAVTVFVFIFRLLYYEQEQISQESMVTSSELLNTENNQIEDEITDDENETEYEITESNTDIEDENTIDIIENNIENIIDKESNETDTDIESTENQNDMPVYTFTYTYPELYTTDSVNVRTGPSTDFEIVATIPAGTELEVTGQCNENGWYRIEYNGQTTYISNEYTTSEIFTDNENEQEQQKEELEEQELDETTVTVQSYAVMSPSSPSADIDAFIDKTATTVETVEYLIQPLGDISDEMIQKINEKAMEIPETLRQYFIDSGWKWYVSEQDIGSTYADNIYGKCMGLTVYSEKTIYMDNREKVIDGATFHEFGHFLDWYYEMPSQTPEWTEILQSEGETFRTTFKFTNGVMGTEEYFAEAFAVYMDYNTEMQNECPQMYNFMDRTLDI